METVAGGSQRPVDPPSIFPVPSSSLPTPKPAPRPDKVEFATQSFSDKKDKFEAFHKFDPKKELMRKYPNVVYCTYPDKIMCIFLSNNDTECQTIIYVF